MAAETETDTASGTLISERVAGGILPKVLSTFDMVAIFVAIVLFITNAAVIQSAGPAAFGWWVIGFIVFLAAPSRRGPRGSTPSSASRINHVGARSPTVVAESLELAPFGKVLFSSDAWGPPELHYLGALLWRRATARVLGRWVESGDWAQRPDPAARADRGAERAASVPAAVPPRPRHRR